MEMEEGSADADEVEEVTMDWTEMSPTSRIVV